MAKKLSMIWETADGIQIDVSNDIGANAELNILVAERVMGLKNIRVFCNVVTYDAIYTHTITENGGEKVTYQPAPVPDYCNDIAAAWQVVNKLLPVGYFFRIAHIGGDTPWLCDFGMGKAEDVTPSRAICRAALKAVENAMPL